MLYIVGYFGVLAEIPGWMLLSTKMDNAYSILGTFVIQIKQAWTYYRNFGIFSEPGQFQIYIVVGLFVELFVTNSLNYLYVIVYVLTLVSCNSTNGFIASGVIFGAFILDKNKASSKNKKRARVFLSVLIPVAVLIVIIYRNCIPMISQAKAKLVEFLIGTYTYDDLGTGIERRAIDLAIKAYFKNPIFGIGFKGVDSFLKSLTSSNIIMTFSPLMWFTRFGILYGLFANIAYFGGFLKYIKKSAVKCVVFVAIFLMISAQTVTSDALTWIVIFYYSRESHIST